VFLVGSNKTPRIITSFPTTVALKGTSLEWPRTICPYSIDIVDSLLILIDQCNEKKITVFNNNTRKLVNSFATIGEGPGEYPEVPVYNQQVVTIGKDKYLVFHDYVNCQLCFYNVKTILNETVRSASFKVNYPKTIQVQSILYVNSSLLYGTSCEAAGKIFTSPASTTEYNWIQPHVIPKDILCNEDNRKMVDFECITIKPDNGSIIGVQRFLKTFNIYDSNFSPVMKVLVRDSFQRPDFSAPGWPSDRTRNYYTICKLTKENLFLLNQNQSQKEYAHGGNSTKSEIHIFDYQGNPKAKLELDRSVFYFTLDPIHNAIICLAEDDETMIKYPFDFKDF